MSQDRDELLARAGELLGSPHAADQWLRSAQVGLGGRRPIDEMATPEGAQRVSDYLTRIEDGVYT